jgi:hypothetical protein
MATFGKTERINDLLIRLARESEQKSLEAQGHGSDTMRMDMYLNYRGNCEGAFRFLRTGVKSS